MMKRSPSSEPINQRVEFVPFRRRTSSLASLTTTKIYDFNEGAKIMLIGSPLAWLLICIPLLIPAFLLNLGQASIFILSLLSLAPIAERLGYVTEQIALHTNDTIGGLLNATFGNMTELIVGLTALFQGYYRLVQLSLLGSILSNMLLVLGSSFVVGGLQHHTQRHGKITSQINSTLIMVATMGLLFPTILTLSGSETSMGELALSRGSAIILLALYCAFLYYQLFVPHNGYEAPIIPPTKETLLRYNTFDRQDLASPARARSLRADSLLSESGEGRGEAADNNSDDIEEEDTLGLHYSIFWLAIVTVIISYLSDLIVATVDAAADSLNISSVFLSAIIIPIIGNAAEHASAITFGYKNRLELSLGIAVGSSTQIALLVLPLLTVVGWIAGRPMSFNFSSYEATTLLLTIITVTFALKDGKSNWLLGFILMGAYGIIALGFWAHTDEPL